MAEVYWDLEWTLQQQGFDYAYDKRLYDRLRDGHARPVREHFHAGLDYQDKLARFLENHDEPRAAATFPPGRPRGRGRHHLPVAGPAVLPPGAVRGPQEAHLAAPGPRPGRAGRPGAGAVLRPAARPCCVSPPCATGEWQLLECVPAWDGNWTYDCFVAFAWQGPGDERRWSSVNYADNQSQCYVRLPFADLGGKTWRLQDRLGERPTTGTATAWRHRDCSSTWSRQAITFLKSHESTEASERIMGRGEPIESLPIWGVFLATVAVVVLAIEGGVRLGQFRRRRSEQEDRPPVGEMVAATLALLAFMLAFAFGLAASRYDVRRGLVVDEANAIGTTYLRAALLPEPHRTGVPSSPPRIRGHSPGGGRAGEAGPEHPPLRGVARPALGLMRSPSERKTPARSSWASSSVR